MDNSSASSSSLRQSIPPSSSALGELRDLKLRLTEILAKSKLVEASGTSGNQDLVGVGGQLLQAAESALVSLSRLEQGSTCSSTTGRSPANLDRENPLEQKPKLLVVDDNSVNRELLSRRLELQGYEVFRSENGRQALDELKVKSFDLVLLDIMMPEIDGYQVLKQMKADESLQHIPVIMISALGDLDSIVRCIEVGAEDYLPKPFNSTLLVARVEACLEKKRLRDQEQLTYQALVRSQKHLADELAEAASYVRALLPPPIHDVIKTEWLFIPSTQLGGDSFGYFWLDEDHFALYLLDVCGHGVGAALLSISVVNVLRSQSLPHTDFRDPSKVLEGLNEAFPMEKQNNMYFTIWYGVFQRQNRELKYAIGGHPHAVLITGPTRESAKPLEIGAPGLLIGGMPDIRYKTHTAKLDAYAKLILFSDGVCEVTTPEGKQWEYDEFLKLLHQNPAKNEESELSQVLREAKKIDASESFEDDFSMVKFLL